MGEDDKDLAVRLSAELQRARNELEGRMAARGLLAADGWRIHEELINMPTGMAYLLRPVHRVRVAPDDLAVKIAVQN